MVVTTNIGILQKKGAVTIPDHGKLIIFDHFVVGSILKQAGLK